jgi:hypothetical protein
VELPSARRQREQTLAGSFMTAGRFLPSRTSAGPGPTSATRPEQPPSYTMTRKNAPEFPHVARAGTPRSRGGDFVHQSVCVARFLRASPVDSRVASRRN